MKRIFWFTSIILVFLSVSMLTVLFFFPVPPLLTGISYSRAVYDDHAHLLRLTLSQDGKYRLMTPLSAMSPQLVQAAMLEEDQYFRWHAGVNPVSMLKAGWQTYVQKSRRVGASTITMQVARIRYHINSKTLMGKARQIVIALQLEMHYSKNQILEAYLNLAPYGSNVEGVGAASLIYFGNPARSLTLPEVLTLAVIPQNPGKRAPEHDVLKDSRDKLFARWIVKHPEDKDKYALMNLPLQMRNTRAVPFLAPHFVNSVLAGQDNDNAQIVTTLDLRLQKIIERVTRNYLARKNNLGVNNAAVLLVDTRNMGIKAMLGSADFFNKNIGGQINGTDILRSPGSTLKPFIYALSLDQSLIHPDTMLKDVPHSFGSYNPENFDNDFVGPVKAKDALTLSRNIPAIYLADQLSHPSLYEFLQQAGINHLKPESYYGLALVLGGAEVSMQELTALYAALANDGVYQPLRLRQDGGKNNAKRVLSPEASFLVLDMLRNTPPPGANYMGSSWQSFGAAWKTGTSSGFRDAWTAGIVGPYVLTVWIGNFNNQSNQVFIGKDIAAPLFFEITNAINDQFVHLAPQPVNTSRMHLAQVDVCKVSGALPTRFCPDTEKVWFIPGKSPIKSDTIHREIAIDNKTGLRACRFDQNVHFEVYEFWTSDLLKIFRRAGIQRRMPPPYDADCTIGSRADDGFIPQIVSPQKQVNYIARLDASKTTQIPLSAVVDADVRNVYWFVNEAFLGATKRDKSLIWHAAPGKYVIRVVDDYGRSDARDVTVEPDQA